MPANCCLEIVTCSFSLIVRVTMSCFYTLNDTQTIAFFTKPRESEPLPETGFGELQVVLRLARGRVKCCNNFNAICWKTQIYSVKSKMTPVQQDTFTEHPNDTHTKSSVDHFQLKLLLKAVFSSVHIFSGPNWLNKSELENISAKALEHTYPLRNCHWPMMVRRFTPDGKNPSEKFALASCFKAPKLTFVLACFFFLFCFFSKCHTSSWISLAVYLGLKAATMV